jgi:hypothetical protein
MFKCINFSLPTTKAIADKISVELDSMISPYQVGLIWDIWLNEDYDTRKEIEPSSQDILEIYANLANSTKQNVLNSEKIKDKEKVIDFLQSTFFTLLQKKVGSPLITREDLFEYKSRILNALPGILRNQGFDFIADNFDYYKEYLESQRLNKFSIPEKTIEDEEYKEKDQVSSTSSAFTDNKHNASDEAVYLIASLESDEEIYGMKTPLNFSETWNILQNILADSLDFQDQIKRLEEKADVYPFIRQLLNKLGVVDGIQQDGVRQRRVAQSFIEAFSKQFSDISVATTSKKDSYSTIDGQTEATLKEKFKNKFFSSKNSVRINGALVTDIAAYKRLELKGNTEGELRAFLDFFGIPSNIELTDDIKADIRQIKKIVDNQKGTFVWLDDKELDVKGRVSNIVKLFIPDAQITKNLSASNATGKNQFAIHNHNYFSRFTSKLKAGRIQAKNYFDKLFADGKARKEIISGLQNDTKQNASVFSDLYLTDIAHTIISNMFSNNPIIQLPRTEAKSMERGFQIDTGSNQDDYLAFTKISDSLIRNLYNLFNQDINEKLHPEWNYGAVSPEEFWNSIGIKRGNDFNTFKSAILDYIKGQHSEVKKLLQDTGVITDKKGNLSINFSTAAINKMLSKGWENSNDAERSTAIDTLIDNLSFNMFYWSVAYTKSMYGSLVPLKPSDMFKRFSAAVAEGRQVSLAPNLVNEILADYKKQGFTKNNPTELKVYIHDKTITPSTDGKLLDISNNYSENDVDDAQGIIVFPVYRAILKGINQWSDIQQNAYEKLMKGEKVDKNVFPPLKPVGYSVVTIDGAKVPVFIKTSIYPISPADIKGTYNELKYNYALENGVSLFVPKSAIKIATPKNLKPIITEKDNVLSIEDNPMIDFPMEDFRIQLDINIKDKSSTLTAQLQGTQQRKLLFINAFAGGKPIDEKYQTIRDEYIDALESLARIEETKLFNRLGITSDDSGITVKNLSALKDILRSDMISNEMSINIVDSINQVIDENGKLIGKIDTLPGRQKIMNILNSFITNNLIRLYINGTTLVQASNQGWEITTPDGETSIDFISKEHQKQYYKNKGLRFFDLGENTGAAEILLPAKYKKFVKKDEEGNYIIDDERVLVNLGYRIPTQGHNSILHLRVVGFLPSHLDQLIIVPKEITTQGGSDFDVDKLNLFIPNHINLDGKIQLITDDMNGEEIYDKLVLESKNKGAFTKLLSAIFGKEEDGELTPYDFGEEEPSENIDNKRKFLNEFKQKQLQNKLIEKSIDILSDPAFRKALLTPNSANQLKEAAAELTEDILSEKNKSGVKIKKPLLAFNNIFSTNVLINTIYQMFASKALVGVFASQTTHHSLAQQVGLYFKTGRPFYFPHNKTADGYTDLSQIEGITGVNIADFMGNQLLTASVDAAKDDYLTELGINLQTGDIVAAYIRMGGNPQYLYYWLRLPIIQDYLAELAKNDSILFKSTYRMSDPKKLLTDYLKSKQIAFTSSEYLNKSGDLAADLRNSREQRTYTAEDLKTALLEGTEDKQMLTHLLDDFLFLKDAALVLRRSISTSKFDTAGPGKNLIEAKMLEYAYNRFNNEMNGSDGYTLGTVKDDTPAPYNRLVTDTLLKVFLPNSFPLVLNLYKPLTVLGLSAELEHVLNNFIDNKYNILAKTPKPYIMDAVYSGLANYMVQNGIGFEESLFYGDNTVGDRIIAIQKDESNPLYSNDFIQNFFNIELSRNADVPTILSPINKRLSAEDANHFTGQLEEIKELDPQLYEDLIQVSLFQTGLQTSPVSFYDMIPSKDIIPLVNTMILKSMDKIQSKEIIDSIISNLGDKLASNMRFINLSDKSFVLPNGELKMTDSDSQKTGEAVFINTSYGRFKLTKGKWMRVDSSNYKSLFYNYTEKGFVIQEENDTEDMDIDNRELDEITTPDKEQDVVLESVDSFEQWYLEEGAPWETKEWNQDYYNKCIRGI